MQREARLSILQKRCDRALSTALGRRDWRTGRRGGESNDAVAGGISESRGWWGACAASRTAERPFRSLEVAGNHPKVSKSHRNRF
jgi:hypothetical protein